MGVSDGGGQRMYIFKDGEYGSWLNGATFQGVTAGTHGSPSCSIAIEDGRLNLTTKQTTNNRVANYAFGVAMPQGVSVKKVGINCTTDNQNHTSNVFRFGVSETLNAATGGVAGATVYSGLGIYSLSDNDATSVTVNTEFVPSAESEGYRNYVTILRNERNIGEATVSITDLWIEV